MSGRLILVATPIGNLGDMAPRAVTALEEADVILCEDTRRTRVLLSALEIPARGRLSALHAHNEEGRAGGLIDRRAAGAQVILVSDAGMPGISDPGQILVAAAVSAGIEVTVVPGPSATLGALVVSGFATDRFCMEGFLPRKGRDRAAVLDALAEEERTTIIFESPRRLAATLADLATRLGERRRVVVVRELTKLHEEIWRGTLLAAATTWAAREVRGEVVLVVDGATPKAAADIGDEEIMEQLEVVRHAGMSTRDATVEVATRLGVPRRRVYALATGPSPSSRGAGPHR
jgi:16S rRNA (cytidine1402-2'-O)-methyltransferase